MRPRLLKTKDHNQSRETIASNKTLGKPDGLLLRTLRTQGTVIRGQMCQWTLQFILTCCPNKSASPGLCLFFFCIFFLTNVPLLSKTSKLSRHHAESWEKSAVTMRMNLDILHRSVNIRPHSAMDLYTRPHTIECTRPSALGGRADWNTLDVQ